MEKEYNPKPLEEKTGQNSGKQLVGLTKPYETPLVEKQTTMNFPEKILEKINAGRFSGAIDHCSRCHHCR